MLGKMTDQALMISGLIKHAARFHGQTEIISIETSGKSEITNWKSVDQNARQLAHILGSLGLKDSDRCGTIAWNNRRHLEIYFGVSGGGYVCHTINPRLHPEQLVYIVNDAQDKVLFFDDTFLPIVKNLRSDFATVEHYILMGPRNEEALKQIPELLFYDELINQGDQYFEWKEFEETRNSSLCYTSGTTGKPKGVMYTHRSTILHSLGGNQPDGLALSASDTVLPVVPMFHVNAWGVPYIAAGVGCKIVLPGPNLDGQSLVKLIEKEEVSIALGVPTIWMGLLDALKSSDAKVESLTRTVVGGAALPPSMISEFRDSYGVELIHAWGMTETSPIGTINQLLQKHEKLSKEDQADIRLCQGRPPFGVDLCIVDDQGNALPHDGKTRGTLLIRGPWIIDQYANISQSALRDGWFDTGDIASIDQDGYMTIRDRAKDIIKSGGEWISTVDLENIAIGHPNIANAAVIAARHKKWDERPILIAVKQGEVSKKELLAFYVGKVANWQIPDEIVFVDALPLGATGKVVKAELRQQYGDILET